MHSKDHIIGRCSTRQLFSYQAKTVSCSLPFTCVIVYTSQILANHLCCYNLFDLCRLKKNRGAVSYIISLCSKGVSCCYSECRIGMMLYIWLYPWIWCITASVQCMMIQLYTKPRFQKFGRIYINNTSDWSRTITIPLPNRNYCSDEASETLVVSIGQGYSYCPWPIRGIVYIHSSEFP